MPYYLHFEKIDNLVLELAAYTPGIEDSEEHYYIYQDGTVEFILTVNGEKQNGMIKIEPFTSDFVKKIVSVPPPAKNQNQNILLTLQLPKKVNILLITKKRERSHLS